MCIVFLPCLLICLLGIACSALVIYYQLDKVSKWVKEEGWVGALMSVLFPVLPGGHFSPSLLGGRERGRGGVDQCLSWREMQGEGN